MEIKKEKWESLRIEAQQFTPQEYVAVCSYDFACDCEASFTGNDIYYGFYEQIGTSNVGPGGNSMGRNCYREVATGKIHHGDDCTCDPTTPDIYVCHKYNIGPMADWPELWNHYENGTITLNSSFGGRTAEILKAPSPEVVQGSIIQDLVIFKTSDGKTHKGHAINITNHS